MSRDFPTPIRCTRLEKPLDASARKYGFWWKVMQLIEGGL